MNIRNKQHGKRCTEKHPNFNANLMSKLDAEAMALLQERCQPAIGKQGPRPQKKQSTYYLPWIDVICKYHATIVQLSNKDLIF